VNLALWIVAGILAAVFVLAGSAKLLVPREKLGTAPGGGWVWDFSPAFVKILGGLEIIGVLGLILPAALGIARVLVPLAALGLALVMVCAAVVESRREEFKHVLLNLTYLALAVFVVVGRFFTD
jgi:hypothetical protein